jgi:hypothetical protein
MKFVLHGDAFAIDGVPSINRSPEAALKLDWYLARLRNMEPAEIAHRLAEQAHRRLERRRSGNWARWAPLAITPLPGFAERVLAATDDDRAMIAAAAERTLDGMFSALGRDWPTQPADDLFPQGLWRLDPVTGTLWPGPETYCFDIDFRHDGSRGDVKYVWEINRLQFLVPLAAHCRLTGDRRAMAAIETALSSWMAANPPFQGVAWASGIEVALRAISLILLPALLGGSLPEVQRDAIGRVLAASRYWLARFPSKFSSANNHRIAELAGLTLIGLANSGIPGPSGAELAEEIGKQILPDGSGAEQSPTYAAFSAEMALLCGVASAGMGKRLPAVLDQRLSSFVGFVAWLGSGEPLSFGDDDEGRVISDATHEPDYPRSVAAAIAGYLQQPGPTAPPDLRGLLLGRPPQALSTPAGLKTFEKGGLSIWHGKLAEHEIRLSFDHGSLGYLSIAAHGHADALALTLAIDGRNVLVDPGTYLYGSGGEWRRWFRSTPAHNTLNIGGESQSTISGAFNWSHKARTELVQREEMANGWRLEARHDGYLDRFGVHHHRGISIEDGAIAIVDRLVGGAEREAELVYQLAQGFHATMEDNTVAISDQTGPLCVLSLPPGTASIEVGGAVAGHGGVVSPAFGRLIPAPRIAWRGPVDATGVTTRIRIADDRRSTR